MKVGILGAGVMGLTVGQKLSDAGLTVEILEQKQQIGGLSSWMDYGPFIWDKYYHVILRSDAHLLQLIDSLGLTNQVVWKKTKTGFLWNDRHIAMSNYWEFLTFPALNFFEKGALALGILKASRIKDPTNLETLPAIEWLYNLFGKEVTQKIWQPLLCSKFGTLADQIPATIIWSTLTRYYSTREKGGGKELMGHLYGTGMKKLLEALASSISGEVQTGTSVQSLTTDGKKVFVHHTKGFSSYDKLISTLPTRTLQSLAPELDGVSLVNQPPQYLGVIRLALLLKRPLSPYYVTNLIEKGYPFTGIIGVSALTLPEEHGDQFLVMIPRYDVPHSKWFCFSDEKILTLFMQALRRIWPEIDQWVIDTFVDRESVVQALWIDTPPPPPIPKKNKEETIWSVNSELAGRDTLNNNAIVREAARASQIFLDSVCKSHLSQLI